MPFRRKELKNHFSEDIFQKIRALEKQVKKLEVIEDHVEALRADKGSAPLSNQKIEKDLEKKLLLFIEEAIKGELKPIRHSLEGLSKRISKMEKRVSFYEKWLGDYLTMYDQWMEENKMKGRDKGDQETQIVYQEIKVDKLFVDKYEQVNNLGNLGIKDLSGQLNIGATFENSSNPSEYLDKWTEKADKFHHTMEKLKGLNRQDEEKPSEGAKK